MVLAGDPVCVTEDTCPRSPHNHRVFHALRSVRSTPRRAPGRFLQTFERRPWVSSASSESGRLSSRRVRQGSTVSTDQPWRPQAYPQQTGRRQIARGGIASDLAALVYLGAAETAYAEASHVLVPRRLLVRSEALTFRKTRHARKTPYLRHSTDRPQGHTPLGPNKEQTTTMRSRKPPTPASYVELPKLRHDPQVRKWVQRLLGDPDAKPTDIDETQLAFVHQQVMQRRQEDFEPNVFQRKMVETCPILAAPDFTDPVEDLGHIFAQPEMREFWSAWQGRRSAKGPVPNYPGAKAVMSVLAMAGVSAHVDDAYAQLSSSPGLKRVFDNLEGSPIQLPAYPSVCRLMSRLSENDRCRFEAMRANVALLRWLREHHP